MQPPHVLQNPLGTSGGSVKLYCRRTLRPQCAVRRNNIDSGTARGWLTAK